jgi:hypothetical protein
MPHTCPNATPQHRANSKCLCTCVTCLIGARSDLADDLAALEKSFSEKVEALRKQYEQALDQALKKIR